MCMQPLKTEGRIRAESVPVGRQLVLALRGADTLPIILAQTWQGWLSLIKNERSELK